MCCCYHRLIWKIYNRPSNLLAPAQTWSSYKHYNTTKFLIGYCPQGATSFISKGWGGWVSDKHLTKNCGLLAKLLSGNIILTDWGLDIQESIGMMCAEVKIPAFTSDKQLTAFDVRWMDQKVSTSEDSHWTCYRCSMPEVHYLTGSSSCTPPHVPRFWEYMYTNT